MKNLILIIHNILTNTNIWNHSNHNSANNNANNPISVAEYLPWLKESNVRSQVLTRWHN